MKSEHEKGAPRQEGAQENSVATSSHPAAESQYFRVRLEDVQSAERDAVSKGIDLIACCPGPRWIHQEPISIMARVIYSLIFIEYFCGRHYWTVESTMRWFRGSEWTRAKIRSAINELLEKDYFVRVGGDET